MLETRESILSAALVETLETMAFMSAMPPMEALSAPADPVVVRVSFEGPMKGTLELATSLTFGGQLAENILGPAEEGVDQRQRACDALQELANVLCGTFLRSSREAETHLFVMGLPKAAVSTAEAWQALADDLTAQAFDADGMPLLVRVCVQEA